VGDAMHSGHSRSLCRECSIQGVHENTINAPSSQLREVQAEQRIARPVTWASGWHTALKPHKFKAKKPTSPANTSASSYKNNSESNA
jgi:hypothetical protein